MLLTVTSQFCDRLPYGLEVWAEAQAKLNLFVVGSVFVLLESGEGGQGDKGEGAE